MSLLRYSSTGSFRIALLFPPTASPWRWRSLGAPRNPLDSFDFGRSARPVVGAAYHSTSPLLTLLHFRLHDGFDMATYDGQQDSDILVVRTAPLFDSLPLTSLPVSFLDYSTPAFSLIRFVCSFDNDRWMVDCPIARPPLLSLDAHAPWRLFFFLYLHLSAVHIHGCAPISLCMTV